MPDPLFTDLFQNADMNDSAAVTTGITQLGHFLNALPPVAPACKPAVRVYVDVNTPGTGHITCSCGVVLRLAAPITDPRPGLGFEGIIEIYTENVNDRRIYDFLPQIDSSTHTGKIFGALVVVTDSKSTCLTVGFTGGSDMDTTTAQVLNIHYFLRLSPLNWGDKDQIQTFEVPGAAPLTNLSELGANLFKKRGFYVEPTAAPDWDFWETICPLDQKVHLQMLRMIVQGAGDPAHPNYLFLPAYSINCASFAAFVPKWLTNLLGGLLAAQWDFAHEQHNNLPPVVVVNMDDMFPKAGNSREVAAWEKTKKILAGEMAPDERTRGFPPKEIDSESPVFAALRRRCDFFIEMQSEKRLKMFYAENSAALGPELDWVTSERGRVLYVQVGRVPAPAFSHALYQRTLPAFFEGQNTANQILTDGKPYFHRSEQGGDPFYPTAILGTGFPTATINYINQMVQTLNAALNAWPVGPAHYPCTILGDFFRDLLCGQGQGPACIAYFQQVQACYSAYHHDKFNLGAAYLNFIIQSYPLAPPPPMLCALLQTDASSPLELLYERLAAKVVVGMSVDLLPLLPNQMRQALGRLSRQMGERLLVYVDAFACQRDTNGVLQCVTLGGMADIALFDETADGVHLDVSFTAPHNVLKGVFNLRCEQGEQTLSGIPWIVLHAPYICLTVQDSECFAPCVLTGGRWQAMSGDAPVTLDVQITAPADTAQWQLAAQVESPYPSAASFYALTGGVNLEAILPPPLNMLTDLGLCALEAQYNSAQECLDYIGMRLCTNQPLPILDLLLVEQLFIDFSVISPADMHSRTIAATFGGAFRIGEGEDAGVVTLTASIPDPVFTGVLTRGRIALTDLWAMLLPFIPSPIPPKTAVTDFSLRYHPAQNEMSVSVGLDLEWDLLGVFLLKMVALTFTRASDSATGCFTATTALLPGRTDQVDISISASYGGEEQGWLFVGQQTEGVIRIGSLLTHYLTPDWEPPQAYNYGVKNVMVSVAPTRKSYRFSAETDGVWALPFVPSISVSNAFVTLGCEAGDKRPQYFGSVSGDINLFGIELSAFFDFAPGKKSFSLRWKALTAVVTEISEHRWSASFTLKDQTLGGMVETFVGWATGTSFGLTAPWNLLESVSLRAFSLVFDFTTGPQKSCHISFKIGIGPIDLGVATVHSVSLSYVPEGQGKGVKVALVGSFLWMDKAMRTLANGEQELAWDPTKPQEAPAPPGDGGKYLDLRLLALGQHVALQGAKDFQHVSQAIEALRELSAPFGGEVPLGGPGQPVFSRESSWLIAADFGILKIEDEKSCTLPINGINAPLTPVRRQSGPGYFLSISAVFNDPTLYALRVALDGPAAKMLKGLEFEILYRQISDSVGCYSAQLTLPDAMRTFQAGVFGITMPVLAFEIYTNGDFKVDVGFPWGQDFSRSFTLEAVVAPGIPVIGSAGFYFGKLSSATSDAVPAASNGWFNPVIVFGLGAKIGVGKSLDAGILKAGFSITAFGILTGVIARWLPYEESLPAGDNTQIQDSYYFCLQGSFGVIGRLYGSIDFAIIKAEVNVLLKVTAEIVFASYEPIPITVMALVDVRLSVEIDLGIFSISISLSFSLQVKATFVLQNSGQAPWQTLNSRRQQRVQKLSGRLYNELSNGAVRYKPCWDNLKPNGRTRLCGFLAPSLTVCGDDAATPAEQSACYVPLFFLKTEPLLTGNNPKEIARMSLARAVHREMQNDAGVPSDPFSALALGIARWLIAAGLAPMDAITCDEQLVDESYLREILGYLSDPKRILPVPVEAINSFLSDHFLLEMSLPQGVGQAQGVLFPAVPDLWLSVPDYPGAKGYQYAFSAYHTVGDDYLPALKAYFQQLAVQVQSEEKPAADGIDCVQNGVSVAGYLYADYFAMIGRQMVQAMLDGLRAFVLPVQKGATVRDILDTVERTGGLGVGGYAPADLLEANGDHPLTAGKCLCIRGVTMTAQAGSSFASLCEAPAFAGGLSPAALALENAEDGALLTAGMTILTPGRPDYTVLVGESLGDIAEKLSVSLPELVNNSNLLNLAGIFTPLHTLQVPAIPYTTAQGDTLRAVVGRFAIAWEDFADEQVNLMIPDLFDAADDPNLSVVHLPRYQVGALLDETVRTLAVQRLGAMVSRYGLHGLRLPTQGIRAAHRGMLVEEREGEYALPSEMGLYALMGQQLAIPKLVAEQPFSFSIMNKSALPFVTFTGCDPSCLTYTLSDGDDLGRLAAVQDYATRHILKTGIEHCAPAPLSRVEPAEFPLSGGSLWQGEGITLPHPAQGESLVHLRLWEVSNALTALLDPGILRESPRFAVEKCRFDQAQALRVRTSVAGYGFGTRVSFTVKKVPGDGISPTTRHTYEILGAGSAGAAALERVVANIGENDAAIDSLRLLYAIPNPCAETLICAQDGQSIMGISQVNLSTTTRPELQTQGANPPANTLLNRKTEFLRLLWEASVTRSGGFFLYYSDNGNKEGLPDAIFNEHDEAQVILLTLYAPVSGGEGDALCAYVNTVVTDTALEDAEALSLTAKATPALGRHRFSLEETPADIAAFYLTDAPAFCSENAQEPLRRGAVLTVRCGLYQVLSVALGGRLADIAAHFGTTAAAIREANPNRTSWEEPLPLFTGLRLPTLSVTAGVSPGCSTLSEIASFYRVSVEKLADDNADVPGLFEPNKQLSVKMGPFTRTSLLSPGAAGLKLQRTVPQQANYRTDADSYGQIYLQRQFNLLGYSIAANEDFAASNMGIPVGPADSPDGSFGLSASKWRSPAPLAPGESWNYDLAFTYVRFTARQSAPCANQPFLCARQNPYLGLGSMLQLDCNWQDIFGNRILTDLSQGGENGCWNRSPQCTGYTDSLLALSQWPSAAADYLIEPIHKMPVLTLCLSFDHSRFLPGSEDIEPPAWVANARSALAAYTTLYHQLTDPNGVSLELSTSLIPESENLLEGSGAAAKICGWADEIVRFLADRAQEHTTVAPPEPLLLPLALDTEKLNANNLFELTVTFTLRRNAALAAPGMACVAGILSGASAVPPKSGRMPNGETTQGLSAFAETFHAAFAELPFDELEVAVGSGSDSVHTAPAVWVARLGRAFGSGISCRPIPAARPVLYAPRPLSRELQSRKGVAVYSYRTGQGIDFTTPDRHLDFTDIDTDIWLRATLMDIDSLFTPRYLTAMRILDKLDTANRQQELLEGKRQVADALRALMVPVLADQNPAPTWRREAEETFYQYMLINLSSAYEVGAIVQYPAQVTASIVELRQFDTPPRLYGEMDTDAQSSCGVSFSSPKLSLTPTGEGDSTLLTFALTAPDAARAAASSLELHPRYRARFLEHQIAGVPGIEGYLSSSWLRFVRQPTQEQWPLSMDFGPLQLPLVLRQYPEVPAATLQTALAAVQPGGTPIAKARQWDYAFTYQSKVHRLQDTIHAAVAFNQTPGRVCTDAAGTRELFTDLAQFVTVFPQVRTDLDSYLAAIEGLDASRDTVTNARAALCSAEQMVARLAESLGELRRMPSRPAKNFSAIEFTIREQSVSGILEVTVTVAGELHGALTPPRVDITGYTTEMTIQEDGRRVYRYRNEIGEYLDARTAAVIPERTAVLFNLDITAQQSAIGSLYLKRNEDLVPGCPTAEAFVYQTPAVSLCGPILPSLTHADPLDIAAIKTGEPEKRSLAEQFIVLLEALLGEADGSLSVQASIRYRYLLNKRMDTTVNLPVLMLPSTIGDFKTLGDKLGAGCLLWYSDNRPATANGCFEVELTLLSTLTNQPMPLLHFTELYLKLTDIQEISGQ